MYKNKFVLSIIHDGYPVKEVGDRWNKEVAIPFDSEYKVRLKNKNDKSCTARIFIDNKRVSQLGDIIVTAGGTIDLERYIDSSMDEGKKFKFVPLSHPDVDDPTSSSNGIIKVEFRKAKQQNGIKIDYNWHDYNLVIPPYKEDNNGPQWTYSGGDVDGTAGSMGDVVNDTVMYSASNGVRSFSGGGSATLKSSKSAGATVEGSKSNQQFTYSNLEVSDYTTTLKLKIVGIEKNKISRDTAYKYCSKCGNRIKRVDKYCSECGYKV